MNIVVNVSFWNIALSGYMPRSGIAHSYGNFLVFWGSSILFSTVAAPIPTNSVGDFIFSTASPAFVICRYFIGAILMTMRWQLTVVLICIALIIISVECLFLCLLIICMSSLEKCLFRPAHYLITIIIFFFEMHEFFVYFGNKAFLVASFANIFPKKLHRCWDNQIPHAKEQSWTHTSLVIQNQLKMDQRPKCKNQNYTPHRRKHERKASWPWIWLWFLRSVTKSTNNKRQKRQIRLSKTKVVVHKRSKEKDLPYKMAQDICRSCTW